MTDAALIRIAPPEDLSHLPRVALEEMALAAREIAECRRVLRKAGLNVVGEVLRGQGQFVKLEHYPRGDVLDPESQAQYYYHAHRNGEHGHFHCFLRAAGMPDGVAPADDPAARGWPAGDKAIAHVIALSMDRYGVPTRLFTVNRWVAGDTWYPAADLARMVDRFVIDHAWPSWPTNRWLTAMVRLFRPQILDLIAARDRALEQAGTDAPDILEDRRIETLSETDIDMAAQAALIDRALAG